MQLMMYNCTLIFVFPCLQFSSLDSGVLPLLEGSSSEYSGHDSSTSEYIVDVGHFRSPETSDIKYQPLSKALMPPDDFSRYLRKSQSADNSKKSAVIDIVSDFNKEETVVDHTSSTFSQTFSISLHIATFIVSGALATLVAWIVTAKPRKQVKLCSLCITNSQYLLLLGDILLYVIVKSWFHKPFVREIYTQFV